MVDGSQGGSSELVFDLINVISNFKPRVRLQRSWVIGNLFYVTDRTKEDTVFPYR